MTGIASKLAAKREAAGGYRNNVKAAKHFGQDFKALKEQCLSSKTLFEDPIFPAAPESLGFEELGPDKTADVVWKRPAELVSNPQFVLDGASRFDLCQGGVGDCWLLAAIACLTLNQDLLARTVPTDQSFGEDYAGIFQFQLWQYGEWINVVVDDRLPTRDGKLLFVQSAEGSEFWSALLEKAYAKINMSYEALMGGLAAEGYEDFTGGISEVFDLQHAPPYMFQAIRKALAAGSMITCFIKVTDASETENITRSKLVKGHAYSITGATKVTYRGKKRELVRLRNPWGSVEWTGPWSDNYYKWKYVEEADKVNVKANDGEFWMSMTDFTKHFSILDVCNLTPDMPGGSLKHWNMCTFEGSWRKGSTAGGSGEYPDTFWMNPQFRIKLEEEDDDSDDEEEGCSFLVALMQKNTRQMAKMGEGSEIIGFVIYECSGQENGHLGPTYFQTQSPKTCNFGGTREVVVRSKLPPGEYVIVPSTSEPNKNLDFFMRVFSEKPAKSLVSDDPIKAELDEEKVSEDQVDSETRDRFTKLAGDDKEISVTELKTILNEDVVKRTDIKTDGFSLNTCWIMVNLTDETGNDKLGMTEFATLWKKVQKYLAIYKKSDKDGSGCMNTVEMRMALKEAGFSLSNTIHDELVARYGDADMTIDFDNFVACVMRLEMMFKVFKMNDTGETGSIKLDFTQWLTFTMM